MRHLLATTQFLLALTLGCGVAQAQRSGAASAASAALAPLQAALSNPPQLPTIAARSDWYTKNIIQGRAVAAQKILALYIDGQLDAHDFDTAVARLPNEQDFLEALQSVFYQQSVDHLRQSKTSALTTFMGLYDQKVNGGAIPVFRLTGHYSNETQGVSDQGGFHRATGSIYANFETISPSEWYIIFTHQLLHSLDQNLWQAMKDYGANPHVAEFADWAKSAKNFSDLPNDRQALLEQWIRSGLDRGLWAEYRAWVATFIIYEAGLQDGTWKHIAWMDGLIKPGQTTLQLEQTIYNYLDVRSTDPTTDIFALPLIQSAIHAVRAKYQGAAQLPPLGFLEQIWK